MHAAVWLPKPCLFRISRIGNKTNENSLLSFWPEQSTESSEKNARFLNAAAFPMKSFKRLKND